MSNTTSPFVRLAHWALYGTVFLSWVVMTIVAWWLLAPYNVMLGVDRRLEIYTPVVTQGGLVAYGRHWCKATDDYTSYVTREFVDHVRYPSPMVQVYYPRGCVDSQIVLDVPMLPPGRYKIHTLVEYHVNPLRVKRYEFWSDEFQIREAESR